MNRNIKTFNETFDAAFNRTQTQTNFQSWLDTVVTPYLVEDLLKSKPLFQAIRSVAMPGIQYKVRKLSSFPTAYFVGEQASGNSTSASKGSEERKLKIVRHSGSVTTYAQKSTGDIDAFKTEVNVATRAVASGLHLGFWFADSADSQQIKGVMRTLFDAGQVVNGSGAALSLANLNALVDYAMGDADVDNDPYVFHMSRSMQTRATDLQTLVSIPVTTVEFAGGLKMESYKGIPIMRDGMLDQVSTDAGTVTATASSGGSLTDATAYYYKVVPIFSSGAGKASAANATTASPNLSVTLSV